MLDDALFGHVVRLHGERPWGRVLDAGSGVDSLRFLATLSTESLTAITADEGTARRMSRAAPLRARDRILTGNWTDPGLLRGERFDVVLADYLVGAVDRYAPYFQYGLLRRLHAHVGDRLYLIGLEPYGAPGSAGARLVVELAALRDACILHAGHRPHREYPLEWIIRALEEAGYGVEDAKSFPIVYGERFIREQLDVCRQKLPFIDEPALTRGIEARIRSLEKRARELPELPNGIRFGSDWVVLARPIG